MTAIKNKPQLLGNIRLDKVGKYYLIDSDAIINKDFEGLTRYEMYSKLVEIGALNENSAQTMGVDTFLDLANKILDGYFYIGRFKVYRVSNLTRDLDDQLYEEKMRHLREEQQQ